MTDRDATWFNPTQNGYMNVKQGGYPWEKVSYLC